ncbi:hypothetical protein [Paraburkholderia aromaticivorans]|uniref:hypothetical protein n=1 Tax=Paraburkholderia aromaticivorans TaxID=2026199 RepID=UPI00145603F0|nr:hypothetical protein [Paraburkholderia aromaticivorans]
MSARPKLNADGEMRMPFFLRGWQRGLALWTVVLAVNVIGNLTAYALFVRGPQTSGCMVTSITPLVPGLDAAAIMPRWWDAFRITTPCQLFPAGSLAFSRDDLELGAILGAIATAICAGPLIWFLMHTWFARYDEFRNSLKDGALRAYLERFWARRLISELSDRKLIPRASAEESTGAADSWRVAADSNPLICQYVFKAIYHNQYGLSAFLTPFALLIAVSYVSALLVACMRGCIATGATCSPFLFANQAPVVISAIAGAFMFAVGDSVRCIRQRCMTVSDAFWYALRLFLAIPVGLAVARSADPKVAQTAVAFGLAMFPLNDFLKVIRRFAFPQILSNDNAENGDKLLMLGGVTLPIAAMFAAEGIYSIEQLATTDPVVLSIRTGLPFRFLLSLGSQAVVRRHLGAQADKLSDIGLSDALSILEVVRALDAQEGTPGLKTKEPRKIIGSAVKQLGGGDASPINDAVIEMKFREIAADEYTHFLDHVMPFEPVQSQPVTQPEPRLAPVPAVA